MIVCIKSVYEVVILIPLVKASFVAFRLHRVWAFVKFASFSRYWARKKHSIFPSGVSSLHTLFSKTKKIQRNNFNQRNISQVKQSPHVKIKIYLSTFKNDRKI